MERVLREYVRRQRDAAVRRKVERAGTVNRRWFEPEETTSTVAVLPILAIPRYRNVDPLWAEHRYQGATVE